MTIEQFNKIYIASERERLLKYKIFKIKGFSVYKKVTEKRTKTEKKDVNNIPFIETTIESIKPKLRMDINEFNKLVVAYLKIFTNPIKAEVTNTMGIYIPNIGYVKNKDRGRADVTAQYINFELGVETKQKYETQLESQKDFQAMADSQSFRKYIIARNFDELQTKLKTIFTGLPD